MTPRSRLEQVLRDVVIPAENCRVVELPDHPGYRLGRSSSGAVVLLTPPDDSPHAPRDLRRLRLLPRSTCAISHENGATETVDAGVVEFRPDRDELVALFLRVAEAFMALLGSSPPPGEVSRAMGRLVRLFEPLPGGHGSALGLWGELLTIASSRHPAAMVGSWHARVDDRFDFAAEGSRLEVKTTQRPNRVHTFGLHQLEPVPGATTYVVSIMTTEVPDGPSVPDLVARTEALLAGDPAAQLNLHRQVAATLGPDWPLSTARFDETQALQGIRVLAATAIPRVPSPPPEVLQVDLTVDCSGVSQADPARLTGLAGLVRAPPQD